MLDLRPLDDDVEVLIAICKWLIDYFKNNMESTHAFCGSKGKNSIFTQLKL